jgi:methylglutaconyl-CoA hydratase
MFHRLASFPAPVVSYVRGAAIGGGLGLAVCSDFVLADPSAVFSASEVMLGLVPAVISPYVLRKLGLAAAAPMMLTGRRVLAAEALAMGLAQRLVDPQETSEEALTRVLREFLGAGPHAARLTRALLLRVSPLPDPEVTEFTASAIATARVSQEGQAGLKAFFHKTAPPWANPIPPLDRRS